MPFPQVAHASEVGKSLLAQLDFAGRMEHLAATDPNPTSRPAAAGTGPRAAGGRTALALP
ncbi:hypothetical protein ACFXGO_05740 [Streptomyces roseus]|uniref:hypothetical protein n=1 Tax=Streptomyces roseus TaxID=66430 RepID=UPI003675426B